MNHMRKLVGAARKPKRPEPAPADYCDEVSEATIEDVKKVVASKEDKDEKWEIVHGPAW